MQRLGVTHSSDWAPALALSLAALLGAASPAIAQTCGAEVPILIESRGPVTGASVTRPDGSVSTCPWSQRFAAAYCTAWWHGAGVYSIGFSTSEGRMVALAEQLDANDEVVIRIQGRRITMHISGPSPAVSLRERSPNLGYEVVNESMYALGGDDVPEPAFAARTEDRGLDCAWAPVFMPIDGLTGDPIRVPPRTVVSVPVSDTDERAMRSCRGTCRFAIRLPHSVSMNAGVSVVRSVLAVLHRP